MKYILCLFLFLFCFHSLAHENLNFLIKVKKSSLLTIKSASIHYKGTNLWPECYEWKVDADKLMNGSLEKVQFNKDVAFKKTNDGFLIHQSAKDFRVKCGAIPTALIINLGVTDNSFEAGTLALKLIAEPYGYIKQEEIRSIEVNFLSFFNKKGLVDLQRLDLTALNFIEEKIQQFKAQTTFKNLIHVTEIVEHVK